MTNRFGFLQFRTKVKLVANLHAGVAESGTLFRRGGGEAWKSARRAGRFAACDACQGFGIFRDRCRDGAIVNALAPSAALDEAGIGENFEVMGDSCGSDTLEGDQLAADHLFIGGNGLKNQEARGIRQSL
jgi:hypothetical protein